MEVQMAEHDCDKGFVEDAMLELEQLVHAGSPSLEDIYGEPEVLPRVGEDYQAEIPAITTESEYLQLRQSWSDMENRDGVDDLLCMRLAVPLMWVHDKSDYIEHASPVSAIPIKGSLCYEDIKECKDDVRGSTFSQYLKACVSNSISKVPCEYPKLEVEGVNHPANGSIQDPSIHELKVPALEMDNTFIWQQNYSVNKCGGKHSTHLKSADLSGWHLVPGAHDEAWSEHEQESFLLSLYIFGKSLVQIQKFMESKHMGDIMSFYYGKFFKSDAHRKWSDCRKIRSKRCIHGHRIFHGPRKQELLNRLMPHVPEESKHRLLENTRAYNEGKVTLEEYVTMLKFIVGLTKLVEAVGIGKGKQDLTCIIAEPARTNQPIVAREEIPAGKACSSLTSEEIIKFLTGDFRLSKARSNDLFWEAVWPRLLARGWHSEQPKNDSYVSSKNSLVFLIPGVKKFSRRKLVKGTHYFDSLSDVLNKVALESGLLEIEADETKGSRAKEGTHVKLDEKDLSDHQCHCYLRPRISNTNSESVKFTVVDTSMAYEEPCKVRDMRPLPVGSGVTSPTSLSTDNDNDGSEELIEESSSAEETIPDYVKVSPDDCNQNFEKSVNTQSLDSRFTFSEPTPLNVTEVLASKKKVHESDHTTDSLQNKALPPSKRLRMNSLTLRNSCQEDDLPSTAPRVKEEVHAKALLVNVPETGTTDHYQELGVPETSFSGRYEATSGDGCLDSTKLQEKDSSLYQEKSARRPLIDLNLPHWPDGVEKDDVFNTHGVHYEDNPDMEGVSLPAEINQQTGSADAFEPSDNMVGATESVVHAKRQSTRNRPLTVRALEALACGLWSTKRRGQGTKSGADDNPTCRSRRRQMRDTRVLTQSDSLDLDNATSAVISPEETMDEEGSPNKVRNHIHSDKGNDMIGLSKS